MNFSFLNPLLDRKKHLEQKISEAKVAMIEAESALAYCDDLERSIPAKIDAVRANVVHPFIAQDCWSALEDSLPAGEVLLKERNTIEALEALKRDLPEIRARWEKRHNQLAA